MGAFAEYVRETEEINRRTAGLRKLRAEMQAEDKAEAQTKAEAEAREALQAEHDAWARDEHTAAEWDRWYLQTLVTDSDAEEIAFM